MITIQRGSGQRTMWADVRDYGATVDGVTDDTAALQAALNSGKLYVYSPTGTCRHTGLTVPTRVSIIGDAANSGSVWDYTLTTGNGLTLAASGEFNQIRNMKLSSDSYSTGWAIYQSGTRCADFIFESVSLENFYKGFYTDSALNGKISQMRISGRGKSTAGGMGIQLASGSGLCTFDGIYASALLVGMDLDGPGHVITRPIMENCTTGFKLHHKHTLISPYFNEVDTIVETISTNFTMTDPIVYHSADGGFLSDFVSRMTLDASGEKFNFLGQKTYVSAGRTTNQTIGTASDVDVVFNSSVVDRLSEYNTSTGVFTAKKPGDYRVSATCYWASAVASTQLQIFKNSSSIALNDFNAAGYSIFVNGFCTLSRGDTVKIVVHQNSGVDKDLYGGTIYNHLEIEEK